MPGAPSPTQVPGQGAGATDPPPPEAVAVPARTSGVRCATDCLYVDGRSGSDARDGRTPATALATLQRAADAARPGTTVLVMGGVYTSDGSRPPLTISASGSPDAWVTFAAAPGEHVVIQIPRGGGATAGVHLRGASYIVIDGFEVVGQNATITPAEAAANDGTQAFLNENCIYVDGQGFAGSHPPVPHDIVIRNSTLHGCSAAGIEANVADGLTIAYNEVYDDAWWTVFGTSGIGLYHLTDAPGAPRGGGYRNLIVGNVVHHNRNNLPFRAGTPPAIYDGNGIIVDDARHAQAAVGVADVQGVPYSGRTYIANNVVHDNGGHGIHVFSSDHVDIVNNTAFNDLLSDSEFISPGTIDAQACSDVNVVNNVAILRSAKSVNVEDGGAWDYNVLDGANAVARGAHDVHADAGLRDPAHGDFAPGPGSPALGTGTTRLAPTLDANGRARVWTAIDRGAIQVSR